MLNANSMRSVIRVAVQEESSVCVFTAALHEGLRCRSGLIRTSVGGLLKRKRRSFSLLLGLKQGNVTLICSVHLITCCTNGDLIRSVWVQSGVITLSLITSQTWIRRILGHVQHYIDFSNTTELDKKYKFEELFVNIHYCCIANVTINRCLHSRRSSSVSFKL